MKTIFLILSSLFVFEVYAQSFEGRIIYNISYQSKALGLESEQLGLMMGTKQAYVIKGNNYKSAFNGVFIKLQMYRGDENRNYTLTGKSDTLYWEDYSINKDEALSYEIRQAYDTIFGVPCDLITVQTSSSLTQYFYNSYYSVNPEVFAKHNYGNWHYIISKTKALPLKTIYETEQFIITSEAVEIAAMELKDNVFEVQNKDKVAKAIW